MENSPSLASSLWTARRVSVVGFGVEGLGFGLEGSGFGVKGLGFKV